MKPVLAALLLVTPLGAQATNLDDNHIRGGLAHVSPDHAGSDLGAYLAGAVRINQGLFAWGDVTRADPDYRIGSGGRDDFQHTVSNLGLGWRIPISPVAEYSLEAGWVRTEVDRIGPNLRENGVVAAFGVRALVAEKVELTTRAGYTWDGPAGNGYLIGLGSYFRIGQSWGLTVEGLTYGGDDIHGRLGARFSF